MNHHFSVTLNQSERRQKSDQTKTMIAMQVRQENVPYALKFLFMTPQFQLRAFAAIHHEELVTKIDYLRCRLMSQGRCGGTTP
jgi:hypothetical protein